MILISRSVLRAHELHVADVHGAQPLHLPDHPGNRNLLAGPADDGAGIVEVDAFERRREAIEVAFAPHLAVADDVDAGALLIVNRDQRRIVLGLFEEFGRDAPELAHPDPRRRAGAEQSPIDQPVRLRVRADERGRQQRK